MQGLLFPILYSLTFGSIIAPIVNRDEKKEEDKEYKIEGANDEVAQLHEYYRYVKRVMHILDKDPEFIKRQDSEFTEQQIKDGFLVKDLLPLLKKETVEKLNRVKAEEIKHQKLLLAANKKHMEQKENNEWNPIHHEKKSQESFTQEDLWQLMNKYNDVSQEADRLRKEKFKKHEMKKEATFRKKLKNMTEEEKVEAVKKHDYDKTKVHEPMHAPGHKAQLEEVWTKQDGLDEESFDMKTLFKLHDKNSDGYLEETELETLFLSDLEKVYNETEYDFDPVEREEEMERMRETTMKEMDTNNDGLVSYKEFMDVPLRSNFEEDPEWTPIHDEDQYSEEELAKYEEEDLEEEDIDVEGEQGEDSEGNVV